MNNDFDNEGWDDEPLLKPSKNKSQQNLKITANNLNIAIAFFALLATGFSTFYAYKAFSLAQESNKSSDLTSAQNYALAEESFRTSSKYNDSVLKLQFQANEVNRFEAIRRSLQDSITNALQLQGIFNAQKHLATENKKFQLENTPFLQLDFTNTDAFSMYSPPNFRFNVVNMGRYPIKIIESGMAMWCCDSSYIPKNYLAVSKLNAYVINGAPYLMGYSAKDNLGDLIEKPDDKDLQFPLNFYLYFQAYFVYENLANNKLRKYSCVIRRKTNSDEIDFIVNENTDLN